MNNPIARVRGSSVSCKAAIPHAKAVRNWSSTSLVKCASKSTASHYFTALLCCWLAVGLKRFGQAARVVQRVVHGVGHRQIAQQGTTVNVALRKDVAAHHHLFSNDVGTLILESPGLHAQVASYKIMNCSKNNKISPNQSAPYLPLCPKNILKIGY